jgi:ribosome-binding protein aMBF1 (putative translation factor)
MMERAKRRRLERAGWRVGSARDFLGLSAEEAHLVDMKLALSERLRAARMRRHWTQADLARHLGSSQSRVAKMEAGDPGVTLDLLVRGLLAMGASPRDIAKALTLPQRAAAG